jgi:hypothetical protein
MKVGEWEIDPLMDPQAFVAALPVKLRSVAVACPPDGHFTLSLSPLHALTLATRVEAGLRLKDSQAETERSVELCLSTSSRLVAQARALCWSAAVCALIAVAALLSTLAMVS